MAETPKLTIVMKDAGDTSIKIPPPGRLVLSPEARRALLKTGLLALEGVEDPAWPVLEDALLEAIVPVRYVTGMPRDTQANERLTPKPLHEHVPGGWNFVEPQP